MARPKTIKLGGNAEIVLKNCPAELTKSIEEHVEKLSGGQSVDRGAVEEAEPNYSAQAIGTCKINNLPKVVLIDFDPITLTAVVRDVVACEDMAEQYERFKILTVTEGIL